MQQKILLSAFNSVADSEFKIALDRIWRRRSNDYAISDQFTDFFFQLIQYLRQKLVRILKVTKRTINPKPEHNN